MWWCVCSFSGDLWFVLFISTLSSLVFLYRHPHPITWSVRSYLQWVLNYRGLLNPTNQRKRKKVSKHHFWLSNRNVATNSVPDVQKASRRHFTSRCLSVSAACASASARMPWHFIEWLRRVAMPTMTKMCPLVCHRRLALIDWGRKQLFVLFNQ